MSDPQDGFEIAFESGPDGPFFPYAYGFQNGLWFGYDATVLPPNVPLITSPDHFVPTYTERGIPNSVLTGAEQFYTAPHYERGVWWLGAYKTALGVKVPYLLWSDDLETWNTVAFAGTLSGVVGEIAVVSSPTYYEAGGYWWSVVEMYIGGDSTQQAYIATGDTPTAEWTIHLDNPLMEHAIDSTGSSPDRMFARFSGSNVSSVWLRGGAFSEFGRQTRLNDGRPFVAYLSRWVSGSDTVYDFIERHASTLSPLSSWSSASVLERLRVNVGGFTYEGPAPEDGDIGSLTAGDGKWGILRYPGGGVYWSSGFPIDGPWEFVETPNIATATTLEYGDGTWVVAGYDEDGGFRIYAGDTPATLAEVEIEDYPALTYSYWDEGRLYQGDGEWQAYVYTEDDDGNWREFYFTPSEGGGWGIALA